MNNFSNTCLKEHTYIVTGASSGIGRSAAVKISECGGKVLIFGRDAERLKQTFTALSGDLNHQMVTCDFKDADQVADQIKGIVSQYGPINGIFHASGMEFIMPARLTKQINLNEVFGSSLFAAFGIARVMSQKDALIDGGSIVFMSSVASLTGQLGMTAYSASKAGIDALVRSLACELSPRKIRVNSIASGAVDTMMHQRLTKNINEVSLEHYKNSHLLGFGTPDDIADALIFLLSDASKWITGTTMLVDGGYTVR